MNTTAQNSGMMPAPLRMLIRPMVFLALGLHALLLFLPIPSEQKPKEADDKKDPLKITQLPTAKPASPKPQPKSSQSLAKTVRKPAIAATTPLPLKPPISSIVLSPAQPKPASIPSSSSLTNSSSTSPSSSSSSPVTQTRSAATSTASNTFKGNPAKALHEYLDSLSNGDSSKVPGNGNASTNRAPLEEIIQPELFFKASNTQDSKPQQTNPEGLPGLEKEPLLTKFPIEENLNLYSFYQKTLEPKLKTIFESLSEVGAYGDGPLYKLTRGTYTAYLSLMPPKKSVGAIISVWSKDPRAN